MIGAGGGIRTHEGLRHRVLSPRRARLVPLPIRPGSGTPAFPDSAEDSSQLSLPTQLRLFAVEDSSWSDHGCISIINNTSATTSLQKRSIFRNLHVPRCYPLSWSSSRRERSKSVMYLDGSNGRYSCCGLFHALPADLRGSDG